MKVNCELGILYQEILDTALHEYYTEMLSYGNHSRSECISDLRKLLFNDGVGYGD